MPNPLTDAKRLRIRDALMLGIALISLFGLFDAVHALATAPPEWRTLSQARHGISFAGSLTYVAGQLCLRPYDVTGGCAVNRTRARSGGALLALGIVLAAGALLL